ncbi:MAG TPA: alpha/beta hydrolase fold domain-containing protein [Rugosimonospora sp.]|nr:alpha/beta hydrolase fold domain-containing protein [Rugosimonospora sp.]
MVGESTILYLPATPDSRGEAAQRLALMTGARVVPARYRPTFPAALHDAVRGYQRCEGPVVVAGERLGAGLAAALLVRLRDSGAPLPRCAVLVSALLDLTLEAKSLLLNACAEPDLDVAGLRRCAADYAGGADRTDPLVSPVYANLHGLPPIQLLVAGTDPLLDDSLAFATRAARSGVTVDLRTWPDAAALTAAAPATIATFVATWSPETAVR